ncbi:2-C-methyl-D-erythritol 4-phosphate cytidylyltransferase [bacterium]|nr:2-C-methyl-D-erythritol 4-phosphate cytidylyltransferase [bacterium]
MIDGEGTVVAIVAAGGTGKRMGHAVPKQFLLLHKKPLLIHTLQTLDNCSLVDEVIVGIPLSQIPTAEQLLKDWHIQKVSRVIAGGKERQDTVSNALKVVRQDASIIFTHDAVRPLVSVKKIEETIRIASKEGAAILAVREKCTVKRVIEGRVSETMDRHDLWQVQTPQAFHARWLQDAYQSARRDGVQATDDAMLVERMNLPVCIVEGEDRNIKITSPEDLIIAEALFNMGSA